MDQLLPTWQVLLACYGLCYIIQNKIDGSIPPCWAMTKLVECSFCAGFVSGVLVGLYVSMAGFRFDVVIWPLASGAFCAIVDPIVKFFEESGGGQNK